MVVSIYYGQGSFFSQWITIVFSQVTIFFHRITTVFSHAQTVVVCAGCSTVLCQPTGGRARYFFSLLKSFCFYCCKPFCVSVSLLWRFQRQKGLKAVRLTGELCSVAQFHIAKLAQDEIAHPPMKALNPDTSHHIFFEIL